MKHPPLEREEYIEQAYFFRTYRERLDQNLPAQEILQIVHEEVLATTRLPLAIEFLKGEILLNGHVGEGMARLPHYFTPFQTFVMSRAEEERSKFDQKTALVILEREAEYRSGQPTPAGLFIYQFECLSRNRLGYDKGMAAMADDPLYAADWSEWILRCRLQLGAVEFADLIYSRSEQCVLDERKRLHDPAWESPAAILFGAKEGRIAWANRGKDPLYMFAALQRQLGYPAVPRPPRRTADDRLTPIALDARLTLVEKRVGLIDAELRDEFDISQFYEQKGQLPPEDGE